MYMLYSLGAVMNGPSARPMQYLSPQQGGIGWDYQSFIFNSGKKYVMTQEGAHE